MHIRRLFSFLAANFLLLGCTVGPDFDKPAAPKMSGYTQDTLSLANHSRNLAGGGTQVLVNGEDIPEEWWKLFDSKSLDDLIKRALAANPNLKAAQAALKVAHEDTLAGYGAYYPSVSAGVSASRNRTSTLLQATPNSGAYYYNLYTPQVSVSYAPDVFGLNRRTVESLKAQEEQTRFALIATNITLSANVVAAAIQEASLREQITATREIININADMLRIMRNQFAKGSASQLDVAAQESQLAQVSAALPPLLGQLAQQRDSLAVLTGAFPGDRMAEIFTLSDLKLPHALPLTLPARLVEQRPDVRQAEENLHAASAQVGIAVANRLPNVTLTGDLGTMALLPSQIFTSAAGFWTLAAGITQPVFDGGTLMHRERAARAALVEASEQYHGAVLTAFQNVADTLHALEQDAHTLNADVAARDAAKATLDLTERQLQTGAVNYLSLLSAEQAYHQASITLVQAQASRFADTAALFQALGGGWWHEPELAEVNK